MGKRRRSARFRNGAAIRGRPFLADNVWTTRPRDAGIWEPTSRSAALARDQFSPRARHERLLLIRDLADRSRRATEQRLVGGARRDHLRRASNANNPSRVERQADGSAGALRTAWLARADDRTRETIWNSFGSGRGGRCGAASEFARSDRRARREATGAVPGCDRRKWGDRRRVPLVRARRRA